MRTSLQQRADQAKAELCKKLITVLENSTDVKNDSTVIRNINTQRVEKLYVVIHWADCATSYLLLNGKI